MSLEKTIHYRTGVKRHLLQPQRRLPKHRETPSKSEGIWIES